MSLLVMLKFCKNFRSVFSVACCRVIVHCERVELNFIGCHAHETRFSKFLYATHNTSRYVPLKTGVNYNNDCFPLDYLFMAKHKKTSHHSRHKDSSRSVERKIHKHSKKKRKEKSHSRSPKKLARRKRLIFDKPKRSNKRASSIPEIFLADSDSDCNDITVIFDSRVGQLSKTCQDSVLVIGKNNNKEGITILGECINRATGSQLGQLFDTSQDSVTVIDKDCDSEVTIVQENILINENSQEAIKNIPLPDEICVVPVESTLLESLEVSSIPLPENNAAIETVDSAELQAAIRSVKLSGSQNKLPSPSNRHVESEKELPTPTVHHILQEKEPPPTNPHVEYENKLPTPTNHHVDKVFDPKHKKSRATAKRKHHNILKRNWQYTTMGAAMSTEEPNATSSKHLVFNVLSYNVLSQSIMEDHPDLYRAHDPRALDWNYRSQLLMKEFRKFNADILCLQEVQKSHLIPFYNKLHDIGYTGIYKQRTGDKVDGVAIYFKNSVFDLRDYTTIEYSQPGIELLNRDNVGLVAKLAPRVKPEECIVVATTHLLFNPRRHDIKLAQTQILLAEIERFAFKGFDLSTGVAQYWPVILTGDLNLEPHTGVYQLLSSGSFQYEGLSSKTLTPGYGRTISKQLLPRDLYITDTCQHWNIFQQRHVKLLNHTAERNLLKIYNSDYETNNNPTCTAAESWEVALKSAGQGGGSDAIVCNNEMECFNFDINEKEFSTGTLSHNLNLKSVYVHDPEKWYDNTQVSTYQERWVVVDYIFYSSLWEQYLQQKAKDNLKLLARYTLFSEEEAEALGPIPNLSSPSDHYPLCAKFALLLI